MGDIRQPHDRIYRRSLGREEVMAEFLDLTLPEPVREQLNLETLAREHESYIDESMSEHFTDLLYTLKLKDDKPAKVFCLLEHKSTPERGTALQVLRYMTNIWSAEYDGGRLSLILPIVFYHGDREWNAPRGVRGLIEGDVSWAGEQIPEFRYFLYQLEEIADLLPEMTVPQLRVYIKALRVSRARDAENFKERLLDYARELRQVDRRESWLWAAFLRPTLIYILETAESEKEEVIEIIKKEIPERSEEVVTVADKLREEGRQEGRKEGRQEGKNEELINTLKVQLRNKFSLERLPQDISNRLETCSRDKLLKIRDEIFEINNLDMVREILK